VTKKQTDEALAKIDAALAEAIPGYEPPAAKTCESSSCDGCASPCR
jgi:hypothetical protein